MTKVKIFVPAVCLALLLGIAVTMFAGCGQSYSYQEFQNEYVGLLEHYKAGEDEISFFDENGDVKFNYANPKMRAVINSNDVENKVLMYTRLSSDLDSDQAVFEPVLRASLMYVTTYIKVQPVGNVPNSVSTTLYEKLGILKDGFEKVYYDIKFFNVRGTDFNASGGIEKSRLEKLRKDYYALILSACDLSQSFIEATQQHVFQKVEEYTEDNRVAKGLINRYYLSKLSLNASIYAKGTLSTFYNQSLNKSDNEYFTSLNTSRYLNANIKNYLNYKSKLADFENMRGGLTPPEREIIKAYQQSKQYDVIFSKSQDLFNSSLSFIDDMTLDLDEQYEPTNKIQAYKTIVKNIMNSDYVIATELLNNILLKVRDN